MTAWTAYLMETDSLKALPERAMQQLLTLKTLKAGGFSFRDIEAQIRGKAGQNHPSRGHALPRSFLGDVFGGFAAAHISGHKPPYWDCGAFNTAARGSSARGEGNVGQALALPVGPLLHRGLATSAKRRVVRLKAVLHSIAMRGMVARGRSVGPGECRIPQDGQGHVSSKPRSAQPQLREMCARKGCGRRREARRRQATHAYGSAVLGGLELKQQLPIIHDKDPDLDRQINCPVVSGLGHETPRGARRLP